MSDNINDPQQQDLQVYQAYLQLWQSENPIKTNKLQILLLTNAILVSALHLAGGLIAQNALILIGGALFSLVWILSIGRTSLFQKVWQIKAQTIAQRYPGDARFAILDTKQSLYACPAWLRALGQVSSKYYLLGTPFLLAMSWLGALAYLLIHATPV